MVLVLICLFFSLVCSSIRKEGSWFERLRPITAGKAWQWKPEAVREVMSAVGKQRESDAVLNRFSFSLFYLVYRMVHHHPIVKPLYKSPHKPRDVSARWSSMQSGWWYSLTTTVVILIKSMNDWKGVGQIKCWVNYFLRHCLRKESDSHDANSTCSYLCHTAWAGKTWMQLSVRSVWRWGSK